MYGNSFTQSASCSYYKCAQLSISDAINWIFSGTDANRHPFFRNFCFGVCGSVTVAVAFTLEFTVSALYFCLRLRRLALVRSLNTFLLPPQSRGHGLVRALLFPGNQGRVLFGRPADLWTAFIHGSKTDRGQCQSRREFRVKASCQAFTREYQSTASPASGELGKVLKWRHWGRNQQVKQRELKLNDNYTLSQRLLCVPRSKLKAHPRKRVVFRAWRWSSNQMILNLRSMNGYRVQTKVTKNNQASKHSFRTTPHIQRLS